MKRSEEIRRKIKEKELEKEGWARDYRTQTTRLDQEIGRLNRELWCINGGAVEDVEIP